MKLTIEEADEMAATVVRAYQELGEFAVLVRSTPSDAFSVVTPGANTVTIGEFLHLCATSLIEGHGQSIQLKRKN